MGPLGGLGGWYPPPPRSYQPTHPFQPSQVIPSLVDPRLSSYQGVKALRCKAGRIPVVCWTMHGLRMACTHP